MLSKIAGGINFYKYKRKIFDNLKLIRNYSATDNKIKVLFFGTDNFSLPSLQVLHNARFKSLNNSKVSTVNVVTSFKSPANCIKCYAEANKILTHKWPIDDKICQQYDLGVVVSFGHLIPENIIKAFPLGMINVHASILPRWRGAAPIIYAIMKGDSKTGVSIMRIEPKKFDIGDIFAQQEVPIGPNVLMPELHDTLANEGANLLNTTLQLFPESLEKPLKQKDAEATYAPKVMPALAEIDWKSMVAVDVYNLYRALFGFKHLSTRFQDFNVKLVELQLGPKIEDSLGCPGRIKIVRSAKCLRVHCKDGGTIDVLKVKVEGKRTMTALEFTNGFLRKCEKAKLMFH